MKRILPVLCSISVLLSCTNLSAFAAEKPVPVDIDPVVYEKILSTGQYADPNMDGIMTEEELRATDRLTIYMDDVTDLSWLKYMDSCKLIQFRGGTVTDYSPVKDMPKLETLQMISVPVTDISFAKDMHLKEFRIIDMPQITLEQRLEISHWDENITVEQGFQKLSRISPTGVLGDPLSCSLEIEDISVARILNGFTTSSYDGGNIYGVAPGKTTYRILTPEGVEAVSGTITVTETKPFDPPLGEGTCTGERYSSNYYDRYGVILQNGTLYSLSEQEPKVLEENVKAYASGYRFTSTRGIYQYFDAVAKNDGTLLLNKKVVPDIDCADIQNECVITKSGELYGIYPNGKEIGLVRIADDFKEFSFTEDAFYINQKGEVIGYEIKLLDENQPSVKLFPTGIMNPISMHYNLFVDENHVLWHPWVKNGELGNSKIAENVTEVGYYRTGEYYLEEYLYRLEDGTYHPVYKDEPLTPAEGTPPARTYLDEGNYYIGAYKDAETGHDGNIEYILTHDRMLTLNNNGEHAAITKVEKKIHAKYDKELGEGYAYFFRTDGSIWRYCFERKEFEEVMSAEQQEVVPADGDVNGDGEFSVTDVVTFQKWLLAEPDASLKDWKAADLYADNCLDVFDLSLMKRALLKG